LKTKVKVRAVYYGRKAFYPWRYRAACYCGWRVGDVYASEHLTLMYAARYHVEEHN
jgi:hypothetical protein